MAALEARLEQQDAELAALKRQVFGKKSEKLPPVSREVRKERPKSPDESRAERKRRAEERDQRVEVVEEKLPIPEEDRRCPKCDSTDLKTVGEGKPTTLLEFVPGYFRKRVIRREFAKCTCGQVISAPTPEKTTDKTQYAPSFIAHLMVQKCSCHMPLYRLEKYYSAIGIPLARSTMTDLLHRNASLLTPLVSRLLARIAAQPVVHADETPLKSQSRKKRGYMWTFLADNLIGYVYSPSRSGNTPKKVLGSSAGALIVDAFSGYNAVVTPDGRKRGGCLAHARRKVFDSKEAPDAEEGLRLIRELYLTEDRIKGIASPIERLAERQRASRPVVAKLLRWTRKVRRTYGPRSAMGAAVRYILNNRKALTLFLHDVKVPLDNNPAERALRRVALGRKNFLFVYDAECGANIAGVYSLVATCEANRVDPQAYLQDVLMRVQTHPAERIDELLPDVWRPPTGNPPA